MLLIIPITAVLTLVIGVVATVLIAPGTWSNARKERDTKESR
jgi:hypothetical protein